MNNSHLLFKIYNAHFTSVYNVSHVRSRQVSLESNVVAGFCKWSSFDFLI